MCEFIATYVWYEKGEGKFWLHWDSPHITLPTCMTLHWVAGFHTGFFVGGGWW